MSITVLALYRPAAASAARTSVALSPATIQSCALYLRYTVTSVAGTLGAASGAAYAQVDDVTAGGARLASVISGAGSAPGRVQAAVQGNGIVGGTNSLPANTPIAGDLVEVVSTFDLAGKTLIASSSINGAAAVTGGTDTWTGTAPANWGNGAPKLYINQNGAGASNGDQSIIAAVLAAGAPTLAQFRAWFKGIPGNLFQSEAL